MSSIIDTDKVRDGFVAEVYRVLDADSTNDRANAIIDAFDSLPTEDMGEVSDGYHTFNELYYYRMLYNAAFFNLLPKDMVYKSKRHHTGEECFGGGWFIVMANLPTGQVSNHYELKDWDLFKVPEKEFADEWDGHSPQEAAERIKRYIVNMPAPCVVGWRPSKKQIDALDVFIRKLEREYLIGPGRGESDKALYSLKQDLHAIFNI